MTTHQELEFSDDTDAAVDAIGGIASGLGWCNLTPQIDADDVEVLSPSVFSLRAGRGAPVATFVTSPPKRGIARAGTLGVLHTRGRLGKERIERLLDGAPFALRQDHQSRGLLFEVPPEMPAARVLTTMRTLLDALCDYERTGRWRLDVFVRAPTR